jgi:Membrane protease subunits, stomatin/prohibitin homologs
LSRSALGDAFGKVTLTDALAKQQAIADEARGTMDKAAASLGVSVLDVQLTRVDFPAAMADSVYKRMIAAREQAAADERAKGTAEADQIKADAVGQQQAVLADGYRQAQTIKGEGDAKAAQIAAEAYGSDPQFYQFYQSMQAYKNTFKPGDVIVVDPSSEFFRFMRSPTGGAAPDAPRHRANTDNRNAAASASRPFIRMDIAGSLLLAIALMLIIEGMFPFVFPSAWRDTFRKIAERPPHQIRVGGWS